MRERPVAAGDGRFGGETLAPEVAAQVVSDFVEALAFDLLHDDAAIADRFMNLAILRSFQLHGPEADAVLLVALAIAFNPLLDAGAIVGRGVIAHGFGIGENQGKSIGVLRGELAQQEAGGFENLHAAVVAVEFRTHHSFFIYRQAVMRSLMTTANAAW